MKYCKIVTALSLLLLVSISACSNNEGKGSQSNPQNSGQSSSLSVPTVNMTQSYASHRANFKHVTGIEVPELESLEADEEYLKYYKETDTDYCFDIIGGSACNYQTYLVFENFFNEKLGQCSEGYPEGDEASYRECDWVKDGRWYQTYWDGVNKAIYINTALRGASV